jgi:hypothetical protein
MSVIITYSGEELLYPATVSVTSEYIDYGSRWGAVQKISIQGNSVTLNDDCANSLTSQYNTLVGVQNDLFALFQNDFRELTVDGYSIPNCKLDSIDFQESSYYGAIGFTVSMTAYPSDYFATAQVTDPVNTITYSEQRNNSIQITHKVSAKGINTANSNTSNALENARDYVDARIGTNVVFPPISNITNKGNYSAGVNPAIKPRKIVETIDRMNGSVSVEHSYVIKANQTGDSTMFYTIDCNYDDEKGLSTGTIKGTVTGSIGQDMDAVRADFQSFSPFNKLNTYFETMGHGSLTNQPENMSVNENSKEKTIEFSYTCNSIVSTVKTFEKTFSMQCDYLTDKFTINFSGKVEFRGGQKQRQASAQNFTFTAEAAQALCSAFYADNAVSKFGNSAIINAVPTTFEIKRDLINGVVTINAACDNRPNPPDPGFTSFDYTLTANTSTNYHSIIQFLCGATSALDYNMKTRGEISIQGTATARVAGLDARAIAMATNLLSQAGAAVNGFTDELLVESKVESTDLPDDSGYVYSITVTKTGLTNKTPANFGAAD